MFDYKNIKWIHVVIFLLIVIVLWQLASWIVYLLHPTLTVEFKLLWGTKGTQDIINFSTKNGELPHTGNILLIIHDEKLKLFELNEFASKGIAQSAMFGVNDILINHIKDKGYKYETHPGINGGGSVKFKVRYDNKNHFITLITMLAPSSNWFISSEPIDLLATETQYPLFAYNAGVDSGEDFKTFPKHPKQDIQPITLITSGQLFPPVKTDDIQPSWWYIYSKESAKQSNRLYDKLQPVAHLIIA